jgi:methionyl aminopeptidase
LIYLKKKSEIALMKESGRIVARTLRLVSESIVPGKTTPRQLDALAHRLILEEGGIPSFLNYKGYPATACISVNEVVIHGIPDDRVLQEGDIIDLDFGVIKEGWHADGAWTYPVGTISADAQRLLNVTRESLYQGIGKARVGKRLGDVGHAIQKYVENNGYSVVREMVGHGIGRNLHEAPHSVANYGRPNTGEMIRDGMTMCIEPMVNMGRPEIKILDDGWTAVTVDGKLSAHFEHTIAVTKEGVEILTTEEG